MIKEKKYKLDKKMKTWEQNDMIMKKLRFKKEDLGREIEKKFEILIKNIRDLRDKTMDDLANAFITTEKRIYEIMQD